MVSTHDHDAILLATLSVIGGTSDALTETMRAATAVGGRPFEVIVGSPFERYGARVTFVPAPGGEARLASALGFADHPWGPPAWIGARSAFGALSLKAYHRAARVPDGFAVPWRTPGDLEPQIASQGDDRVEVYFRARAARPWGRFAAACFAPLCGDPARAHAIAGACRPEPRPAPMAHGVSVRRDAGQVTAITVLAGARALPDEATVRDVWSAGLPPADADRYEKALAAVRSFGRLRGGGTHAMLSWTLDADGAVHRAASLAIPVARA